jgi:hypothetical protein
LLTACAPLRQQFLGVLGLLQVLVALIAAPMFGDGLVLVINNQAIRVGLSRTGCRRNRR